MREPANMQVGTVGVVLIAERYTTRTHLIGTIQYDFLFDIKFRNECPFELSEVGTTVPVADNI